MYFKISRLTKIMVFIQRMISWANFLFLYYFYWIILFIFRKHKVSQIKLIREQFKSISKASKEPLLICPNHLTYIDSIVLVMIFGTGLDYVLNFRTMPWNFPRTTHVRKNYIFKILGFLGKCIFIELEQSRNQDTQPIDLAKYLLANGEYVMIFPEGHRSNDGKVDTKNFAYGVGKIVKDLPNVRVLGVYLRGHTQNVASKYPNKYDEFYCELQLIDPKKFLDNYNEVAITNRDQVKSNPSELRKIRQIAKNIVEYLAMMEQKFLANKS